MMEKLSKILMKSLAKKNFSGPAKSAMVCFWAKEWAKGLFQPISFSRGILKVSVSSSPAASELQMQEEKLADYINEKAGHAIIRQIRIINGQ